MSIDTNCFLSKSIYKDKIYFTRKNTVQKFFLNYMYQFSIPKLNSSFETTFILHFL